jgi:hypothetical protein
VLCSHACTSIPSHTHMYTYRGSWATAFCSLRAVPFFLPIYKGRALLCLAITFVQIRSVQMMSTEMRKGQQHGHGGPGAGAGHGGAAGCAAAGLSDASRAAGANQHGQDSWARTLRLAFQCVGVLYGDIARRCSTCTRAPSPAASDTPMTSWACSSSSSTVTSRY